MPNLLLTDAGWPLPCMCHVWHAGCQSNRMLYGSSPRATVEACWRCVSTNAWQGQPNPKTGCLNKAVALTAAVLTGDNAMATVLVEEYAQHVSMVPLLEAYMEAQKAADM